MPYVALGAFVVALAFGRLHTGGWYQTYNPFGVVLLDGRPVEWEVDYYLVHFPTFLGDAPPAQGIAPVHYRALVPLYLSATLSAWLGSAFWGIAAVDLLMWFAAAVASYHLMRRLGAPRPAAVSATLVLAASPLFTSNMWAHVLHPAEFASLSLGLWAAVTLVEEHRHRVRLALGLGALLMFLSVTYQYQWIVLPLTVILCLAHPRLNRRESAAIVLGALVVYGGATLGLRGVLHLAGLGEAGAYDVVSQPGLIVLGQLRAARTLDDLWLLLPSWLHVERMMQAYHPAVLAAGAAGLSLASWRARWLGLAALSMALVSAKLYPTPWTAMAAFPLVYLGVGLACGAAGSAAVLARHALHRQRRSAIRASSRLSWIVTLAAALMLATITNLDLAGDPAFLLQWWRAYAIPPLF